MDNHEVNFIQVEHLKQNYKQDLEQATCIFHASLTKCHAFETLGKKSGTSTAGWIIAVIVLVTLGAVIAALYVIYKYRLRVFSNTSFDRTYIKSIYV